MRVAILGRTRMLLNTARGLMDAGHEIGLIWTCGSDQYHSGSPNEFEQLAAECGASFQRRLPKNEQQFIELVGELNLDLGISVNWINLMTPAMIAAFPRRIINAHAGDLPRYRGNAVPNWAILAGEPFMGLCVHEMTPELDAGPVYVRKKLVLDSNTYIGNIYDWLDSQAPDMFVQAVSMVEENILPTPQDPSIRPLRGYPRKPEDGLIDWWMPTENIHRVIRASSHPFDGAFTFLEGREKLTIWRAQPYVYSEDFLAVPGQVCFAVDGDPVVSTADGMLRLTSLSLGEINEEQAKKLILRSLRNRLKDHVEL